MLWKKKTKSMNYVCYQIGTDGVDYFMFQCEQGNVVGLQKAKVKSFDFVPEDIKKEKGVVLLNHEQYQALLIQTPDALKENKEQQENPQLFQTLKWMYAKDTDVDIEDHQFDFLRVKDADHQGVLFNDHHWVLAVKKAFLNPWLKEFHLKKVNIKDVDVMGMAQHALCQHQLKGDVRPGCYASLVFGHQVACFNVISHQGEWVYHKKMDWNQSLEKEETLKKIILELQRHSGYVERRLSSFAIQKGWIFGEVPEGFETVLTESLGSFEWIKVKNEDVIKKPSTASWVFEGDDWWKIGAVMRWL